MENVKQFIKSESCPKHPQHGDYYYWKGNFSPSLMASGTSFGDSLTDSKLLINES